jgi:hypothetical protein
MFEILRLFYDIALFKKGPQDVPFSKLLTQVTLLGYALVSFLMFFMSARWSKALLQVATDILVLVIFTAITLFIARKSSRYQQTLCALLGTDMLISLCAIPANASIMSPNGSLADLAVLTMIGLLLWHWAVIGHIFRHALSESFSFGFGIGFLYMIVAQVVMGLFFPELSGNH